MSGLDQADDKAQAPESRDQQEIEGLSIHDAFDTSLHPGEPVPHAMEVDDQLLCKREISDAGFEHLKEYEGLRLKPYKDSHGYAIGYGHRIPNAHEYAGGISEAKAEEFLHHDVESSKTIVGDLVEVPLTQGQFDALTSFVFNVGRRNFVQSTMLEKLNAGDYGGAADEFERWIYRGKRQLRGLIRRRDAEKRLFENNCDEPLT